MVSLTKRHTTWNVDIFLTLPAGHVALEKAHRRQIVLRVRRSPVGDVKLLVKEECPSVLVIFGQSILLNKVIIT